MRINGELKITGVSAAITNHANFTSTNIIATRYGNICQLSGTFVVNINTFWSSGLIIPVGFRPIIKVLGRLTGGDHASESDNPHLPYILNTNGVLQANKSAWWFADLRNIDLASIPAYIVAQ